jgi:hypothetical protein
MNFEALKARHRQVRDRQPEAIAIRIHRALSWMEAAGRQEQDDVRFLLLWIAFNSVYAQEFDPNVSFGEKGRFKQFLGRLVQLDRDDSLFDLVWKNYAEKFHLLINNPYVSRPFWDFQRGVIQEEEWKLRFEQSCAAAERALVEKDTAVFLKILFDRIYMLRNQLMHGGATLGSTLNREQVRDSGQILEQLVPAIIHIVMEHPTKPWGEPCFPPVEMDA